MPINPIVLQRRHAELGRIRLGEKGAKGQPQKLTTFRFSSPNRELVDQVAALYGGEAKAWDNAGKAEHEVVTDAKSIPVIVVKGGFSQWMETWSGGGCQHRCDGVTNDLTKEPCDPDDPGHQQAKPYTRLSVMLRDVESLGVWRMETHGWNAAAELPSMAELAMFVGDLVPATLHLVARTSKIKVNGRVQTAQYVVPVLDLQVSKQRLVELVGGPGFDSSRQIEAGPSAPSDALQIAAPRPDYESQVADAETADDCSDIWRRAGQAGHLDDALKARITARVNAIREAQTASAAGGVDMNEDDAEYVDGEVDEDPPTSAPAAAAPAGGDVMAVWQQLVTEAGAKGVTDPELRALLEEHFAQPVADLTADQLREGLDIIRKAGA